MHKNSHGELYVSVLVSHHIRDIPSFASALVCLPPCRISPWIPVLAVLDFGTMEHVRSVFRVASKCLPLPATSWRRAYCGTLGINQHGSCAACSELSINCMSLRVRSGYICSYSFVSWESHAKRRLQPVGQLGVYKLLANQTSKLLHHSCHVDLLYCLVFWIDNLQASQPSWAAKRLRKASP